MHLQIALTVAICTPLFWGDSLPSKQEIVSFFAAMQKRVHSIPASVYVYMGERIPGFKNSSSYFLLGLGEAITDRRDRQRPARDPRAPKVAIV